MEDAVRLIEGYVRYYNEVWLHSAISHVTPADKLSGRDKEIFTERVVSSTKPEFAGSQFVPSNVTLAEQFKAVVTAIKWIYDGQ